MRHDQAIAALPAREVRDYIAGELVDLDRASMEQLAELQQHTILIRGQIADIEEQVSRELINRLDKDANWTWRGAGLKVTAPSPAAGSEEYPIDMLEGALVELLNADTISPDAAARAIKRQVIVTLAVPLGTALEMVADSLNGWAASFKPDPAAAEVLLPTVDVKTSAAPVAAGIKALRKNPDAAARLDRARVKATPPPRKAKVTVE